MKAWKSILRIVCISLAVLFVLLPLVQAQQVTTSDNSSQTTAATQGTNQPSDNRQLIVAEGTYNMGDGETPAIAEERALLQAKRNALEQAGTYVESYSKTKDYQLTDDEIKVFTAGLMEVTILDKQRTIIGNGIHFYVKIQAVVSADKMEDLINQMHQKSDLTDEYKQTLEAYHQSQLQIEQLKAQLASMQTAQGKQEIQNKIANSEQTFQETALLEQGYSQIIQQKYDDALTIYNQIIAKNAQSAKAYTDRARVYVLTKQYESALADYNSAIQLTPNNAVLWVNRAAVYEKLKQYEPAIADLNKALELNSSMASAYHLRGLVYAELKQYPQAFDDYSHALAINPKNPVFYSGIADVLFVTKQYPQAIENFNKAIELNHRYAHAYYGKAVIYDISGNHAEALQAYKQYLLIGNHENLAHREYAKKRIRALTIILSRTTGNQ